MMLPLKYQFKGNQRHSKLFKAIQSYSKLFKAFLEKNCEGVIFLAIRLLFNWRTSHLLSPIGYELLTTD
jgi:hypothetical protein